MTLIVSVRSAEGIVIAGDTLMSIRGVEKPIMGNVQFSCTSCRKTNTLTNQRIAYVLSANSFPSSRKVFSFQNRFGVGTFGMASIADETTFIILKRLEAEIAGNTVDTVKDCATLLGGHLGERIKTNPVPGLPSGRVAVGLHVNGYNRGQPVTWIVEVLGDGRVRGTVQRGVNYAYSGQTELVEELEKRYLKNNVGLGALVSAGDAIDFAIFLIRTTIDFQRFSRQRPTVGGNVDIGHITPHAGYTWVKKSPCLTRSRIGADHDQEEGGRRHRSRQGRAGRRRLRKSVAAYPDA